MWSPRCPTRRPQVTATAQQIRSRTAGPGENTSKTPDRAASAYCGELYTKSSAGLPTSNSAWASVSVMDFAGTDQACRQIGREQIQR